MNFRSFISKFRSIFEVSVGEIILEDQQWSDFLYQTVDTEIKTWIKNYRLPVSSPNSYLKVQLPY